jgi:thiamine pyrophosphate-dependent acetolactate synthase large subunit-like protein
MGSKVMAEAMKQGTIDRRAFVARLTAACPDALIVTGLGSTSYDVFAAGDEARTFYLWGAMGGAAATGLGLALAQPTRSVLVITGDGEQLMGMGALASIGVQQPPNLSVVVIDNGHFGETGMQRSHTGFGIRLSDVARACKFAQVMEIAEIGLVDALADHVNSRRGPTFAQVFVSSDEVSRALPPRDGAFVKNRFRAALGLQPM